MSIPCTILQHEVTRCSHSSSPKHESFPVILPLWGCYEETLGNDQGIFGDLFNHFFILPLASTTGLLQDPWVAVTSHPTHRLRYQLGFSLDQLDHMDVPKLEVPLISCESVHLLPFNTTGLLRSSNSFCPHTILSTTQSRPTKRATSPSSITQRPHCNSNIISQ